MTNFFASLLQRSLVIALLCFPFCSKAQADKPVAGIPYFSDPALSPDASEIAFVSGGDIWTVPAAGGDAHLLVSHPDYDSRPIYSPDGKYLAFTSTRSGNGDIYVLDLVSNELKRISFDDGFDDGSAWSADGKYIYYSSTSKDIAGMRDIFKIAASGGTPIAVSDTRYVSEFFPMPSPDNKWLAVSAHGVAAAQWWRNGHSHLDESEIWLMKENNTYEQFTSSGAKHLWPMWSSDGKAIYYVSDESGTQNLYMKPLTGSAKKLTSFTTGRVLWPTMAYNGKAIVFERDFKIWYYNIATGNASAIKINKRGAASTPVAEHVKLTNTFRELAVSGDGKKSAFIARGDVFVAATKDGGDAVRITATQGIESQISWAKNSNSIVYISDRDGPSHIFEYNFISKTETRITNSEGNDGSPRFSPDGKLLSYVRNGSQLRVINVASKKDDLITTAYTGIAPFFQSDYTWSPDGNWIAFASIGSNSFRNINVVAATGGQSRPISFLPNSFGGDVSWSKDGKFILFTTAQRTESASVAKIDLVPQTPVFKEDDFKKLFTDSTAKKDTSALAKATADNVKNTKDKEPGKIVWDGIKDRLTLLPLDVDVSDHALSPDGKTLAVIATQAGQENVFTYNLEDQSPVLKQLTTTAGAKNSLQFVSNTELYFIELGKLQSLTLESKQVKNIAVTAELDIDFNKEKGEIFKQAWELQNKGFYDPNFHGSNWNKIKTIYEPLAAGANTIDELRRILALMVGELNASHSGVAGPPAQFNVGKLGLRYDAAAYEKSGIFKITEVVAAGPAALAGIQVGDQLLSIDGAPLSSAVNIDELLLNKTGKMVTLAVRNMTGAETNAAVRPVSITAEKSLLYKQWVQQQRDYVIKKSNGKLGYVHMFDMSAESLNKFYLDIDAENHDRAGVIIDVRNNNGGFVNAYALDVLSRKGYMNMSYRNMPAAPARTVLGQRALDAPTVLLTNQHSLSDAEDFSEGYRSLKLGKIVGEPTGGWIIYTSNITLFDGTVVRLPFIKVTDRDGKNMELVPRPVDIAVSNPLGEKNKDSQLDKAIETLLLDIGTKR